MVFKRCDYPFYAVTHYCHQDTDKVLGSPRAMAASVEMLAHCYPLVSEYQKLESPTVTLPLLQGGDLSL